MPTFVDLGVGSVFVQKVRQGARPIYFQCWLACVGFLFVCLFVFVFVFVFVCVCICVYVCLVVCLNRVYRASLVILVRLTASERGQKWFQVVEVDWESKEVQSCA